MAESLKDFPVPYIVLIPLSLDEGNIKMYFLFGNLMSLAITLMPHLRVCIKTIENNENAKGK